MTVKIDEVLEGVFHAKRKLIDEHRRPKYVVLSKPVETALKLVVKKMFNFTDEELEQQNEIFGLKIIVFDRDDIFYLVG